MKQFVTVVALAAFATSALAAGKPAGKPSNAKPPIPPKPATVVTVGVEPKVVNLVSARGEQRLVVTGKKSDGTLIDLTRAATYAVGSAKVAKVDKTGFVTPVADGKTDLTVVAAGKTTKLSVSVKDAQDASISFINHIGPILSKAGCNAGACHGAQYGKGGFKLSLFGFDSETDWETITKLAEGRRLVRTQPEKSLLLLKPSMGVTHGGGQRFANNSIEYRTLWDWVALGAPGPREDECILTSLEVFPRERVMQAPKNDKDRVEEQLLVKATYSDGSSADVTRLARFNSNDPTVAELSSDGPNGLVKVLTSGETAIMVRYGTQVGVCKLLVPYENGLKDYPKLATNNYVDELINTKLKKMNLTPSELADDNTLVRRLFIDMLGTLPTPEEVTAFVNDRTTDKRAKLIDALMERPEFVDFWTMKWSDILRVNRNFTQEKGMWAFHNWIKQSLALNKPYDQMAREVLLGQGSSYEYGPANFYRISSTQEERAENTVQLFLGIRVQCARCHNHPFEKWLQNDYHSMAAFFSRLATKPGEQANEQLIFIKNSGEHTNPRTKRTMVPKALAGPFFDGLTAEQDRRAKLAEWMTAPENTMFSQAVVNRYWKHFMGRGIVDPPDDMRVTNPPVNAELLERLAKDFVEHKFDLRHVVRVIANSRSYQSSSMPNATNAKDEKQFSRYYIKRLSAETLLDAIGTATEAPEKFAGLPAGTRAIQLPDSRVASYFLDVFGRPAREITCECERSDEANMAQALHLINSPSIQQKLSAATGRVERLVKANKKDREAVEEMYLATLCRLPEPVELEDAVDQIRSSANRKEGVEDLLWALINSREFIFNH